jgi:flagellar L-ring protein precursor FlgH
MNSQWRTCRLTWGFILFASLFSAWMSRADRDTQPSNAERPTGSLWNQNSTSLVRDVRAHRVGDTLTILVQENATATSTAATKTSRSDSANFGGFTGTLEALFRPLLKPTGASASLSTDGQGQTNRSGTLTTKLTAIVKEVLPNGNLLIEGTRIVGVNAEKQKVVIRGVVRPQDIGPGNTVSSVAIADATIQFDGKGPVGDKQRKGILSTIFGWLF